MESKKKTTLLEKIKGIKHIELIVIIAFVCILLLIYSSSGLSKSKVEGSSQNVSTTEEYTNYLEKKLKGVLSSIKNAGNISCMIKLDGAIEYLYATDVNEETTSTTVNDSTSTKTNATEEIVFITQGGTKNPILVSEKYPKVSNVLIVASGAGDIGVRLELQKATSVVLEVDECKVEVMVGK